MEIVTSFKDNPETPVIVSCLFRQVKNIKLGAIMGDCNLLDAGTIYSLSENNGRVELVSVKGWKLEFITGEIEITIEYTNGNATVTDAKFEEKKQTP